MLIFFALLEINIADNDKLKEEIHIHIYEVSAQLKQFKG